MENYKMSSYTLAIIGTLVFLGVLLIILSFIKPKSRVRRHRVIPDSATIINKIEKSKIMALIANTSTKDNKKTLNKLKTLNSKLTLQRILLIKFLIFSICIVVALYIRINFAGIIRNDMLNTKSIYNVTSFRVSEQTARALVDLIDKDYLAYVKNNDTEGFMLFLENINKDNRLYLLDEDLESIIELYNSMYSVTNIDLSQVIGIILFSLIATFGMDFYISASYNIRRAEMLKEFEKLEIIAILLMAREELNVLDLIKEMDNQSKYLKQYFTKCLRLYPASPIKAINVLIQEVDDKDFRNFMVVIRSCLDSAKKTNREMLKIQRELRIVLEQTNLNAKNRKKTTYLTMAQFPLIMVMSLNLILPGVSNMTFNM